jgi:hypothetical protein
MLRPARQLWQLYLKVSITEGIPARARGGCDTVTDNKPDDQGEPPSE